MPAAILSFNLVVVSRSGHLPVYPTRFSATPRAWAYLRSNSLRATASTTAANTPTTVSTTETISAVNKDVDSRANILACPVCYDQVIWSGNSLLSVESVQGTNVKCSTCRKTYYENENYFNLTASSGAKEYVESKPLATEFFSTPFMGFLYERGWRQNFGFGGYPGKDREFELAKEYLEPVLGGKIVDASCGSGLFSRLFAKSGLFSIVVALDYSESMLKQCYEFINQEEGFPKENLLLVRADIARLPFVSGSIDAVHAGAALHCWPSPSAGVAEISRVLRPGGIFVASTTILDGPLSFLPFTTRIVRDNLIRFAGSRQFLSEGELEDLCRTCGLVDFKCFRNGLFVMMCATKPIPN